MRRHRRPWFPTAAAVPTRRPRGSCIEGVTSHDRYRRGPTLLPLLRGGELRRRSRPQIPWASSPQRSERATRCPSRSTPSAISSAPDRERSWTIQSGMRRDESPQSMFETIARSSLNTSGSIAMSVSSAARPKPTCRSRRAAPASGAHRSDRGRLDHETPEVGRQVLDDNEGGPAVAVQVIEHLWIASSPPADAPMPTTISGSTSCRASSASGRAIRRAGRFPSDPSARL